MKAAIVDKKIECGVHSLPGWMQEMLAERMDRFVKAEREANEQNALESSKQETNEQPSQITA